jgi:hypothetical protein
VKRLPGTVNYFIGDDPAQWHTNLPTYAGVAYRRLYPGIGLRYDGKSGTKEECLAYIKEVWTDMRPLSLRRKMEAAQSQ